MAGTQTAVIVLWIAACVSSFAKEIPAECARHLELPPSLSEGEPAQCAERRREHSAKKRLREPNLSELLVQATP